MVTPYSRAYIVSWLLSFGILPWVATSQTSKTMIKIHAAGKHVPTHPTSVHTRPNTRPPAYGRPTIHSGVEWSELYPLPVAPGNLPHPTPFHSHDCGASLARIAYRHHLTPASPAAIQPAHRQTPARKQQRKPSPAGPQSEPRNRHVMPGSHKHQQEQSITNRSGQQYPDEIAAGGRGFGQGERHNAGEDCRRSM